MNDLDVINAAISAGDQSVIPDGSVVEVDVSLLVAPGRDMVTSRLVGKVFFAGWVVSTQPADLEWSATLFTNGRLTRILSGAFARLRLTIVSLPENVPPFPDWRRVSRWL